MKRSRRRFGDYLQALSTVGLPDGNTLSIDERWARKLFGQGVSLDEVADMALVTTPDNEPYLTDQAELYFMLTSGASPKEVEEMLTFTDDVGNCLKFDPHDLSSFFQHGGTKDFAEQLFCLTGSEGMPIFDGESISDFRHYGGTVGYAQEIASLADTEGNTVFSDGDMIATYCYRHKDISLARTLVGIKDSRGRSLFSDGADIFTWLYHGGSLELAESYLSITDTEGETAFNGHDLALFQRYSVHPEYAAAMAARGMNAFTAIYYHTLGRSPENLGFTGNGKPRALLIYPTYDRYYLGTGAFLSECSFRFLKSVRKAYDVRLRAISTVSEMCREIESSPDVSLLMLAGHGTRTSLCFGENKPKYSSCVPERDRILRTSSHKAAEYLAMLPRRATIFLNSCTNGKGRESGKNLANSMAEWAPGRRVISSTDIFTSFNLKVECYYPLEMRIFSDKDGEGGCDDLTYVARRAQVPARGKRKRR